MNINSRFGLFLLLHLSRVLNLEGFEKNHKNLRFHLALEKYNTHQSSTSEIFNQETEFIFWIMKQDNKKTHR